MKHLLPALLLILSVDGSAAEYPVFTHDTTRLSVGLGTEASGLSHIGLSFSGNIPFGGFSVRPFAGLDYTSLGSFLFLQSDDYAYRQPESVAGHSFAATGELLIQAGFLKTGAKAKLDWCFIGDFQGLDIGETAAVAEITVGETRISVEGGFLRQSLFAGASCRTPVYIVPLPLAVSAGVQWTDNLVLRAGLEAWNAEKDLMLYLGYPCGMIFTTDTLMEIALLKRFGDLEASILVRPSVSGNDRYETTIAWVPAFN